MISQQLLSSSLGGRIGGHVSTFNCLIFSTADECLSSPVGVRKLTFHSSLFDVGDFLCTKKIIQVIMLAEGNKPSPFVKWLDYIKYKLYCYSIRGFLHQPQTKFIMKPLPCVYFYPCIRCFLLTVDIGAVIIQFCYLKYVFRQIPFKFSLLLLQILVEISILPIQKLVEMSFLLMQKLVDVSILLMQKLVDEDIRETIINKFSLTPLAASSNPQEKSQVPSLLSLYHTL